MVKSFRDSGEFRESTGFGVAGQGGGDTKQRRSTRQDAVDLANDMDTSKYIGNLRDAIQRKNIDIQNNQRRVAERIAEDPTRAGFRGFLPSRTDIDAFKDSFGKGLDALQSIFTTAQMTNPGYTFDPSIDFMIPAGMNQFELDEQLRQNLELGNRPASFSDFRMPIIDPLGQPSIERVPGGMIFNDPGLVAPNEVVVDPFTGQLIPNINRSITPMFDI